MFLKDVHVLLEASFYFRPEVYCSNLAPNCNPLCRESEGRETIAPLCVLRYMITLAHFPEI